MVESEQNEDFKRAEEDLFGQIGKAGKRFFGCLVKQKTVIAGVVTIALCGVLFWLLGNGLEQWFTAQGMDSERATLLSNIVLVLLATAVAGMIWRKPVPIRIGGLMGFIAIQIIPFLIRAANQPAVKGLKYSENISGWILQPLGMLLLGTISVFLGGALGLGLARDIRKLPRALKVKKFWPVILLIIFLIIFSAGAAKTALQNGPLGALRNYDVNARPIAVVTPTLTSSPTSIPIATITPVAPPTPDITLLRQLPGEIQYLTVSGRAVDVFVAHAHMHVLPRWTGDTSFVTTTGETRVAPEALETTWESSPPPSVPRRWGML